MAITGFTLNPTTTTTAAGTFNVESTGFIQGLTMDSPAIRNRLKGGVLLPPNALSAYPAGSPIPLWGGCAITEVVPTGYVTNTSAGPKSLGPLLMPATGIAGALPISGFTVFDQAHHMVGTPQSQVPIALPGMTMQYYQLGTGARIPLAADPSLVTLQGGLTTSQVSFDFVSQRLVPYTAAYAANNITAATYNNTTGVATYTTTSPHGLVPGNDFSVTGITPAGYNGSFTAAAGTTGSTLTTNLGAGLNNSGAMPAATGFGALSAGGGALPVKILEVAPANCMTVNYDAYNTGNATWNRNGACVLVVI